MPVVPMLPILAAPVTLIYPVMFAPVLVMVAVVVPPDTKIMFPFTEGIDTLLVPLPMDAPATIATLLTLVILPLASTVNTPTLFELP